MKRVIFISFLFAALHSSDAFCSLSVDDYKQMEVEGKEPTYNEITQDQTSYENWVSYVDGKTDSHYNLPSFSDVAVLTENLLAYSVGNYADVASGVFDNLADTFSLGSDIWDFMTFNVQQMTFDYLPDFVNLLKSGVDEEIYTTSEGMWYKTIEVNISGNRKYTISAGSGYVGLINYNSSYRTADVIIVSAGDTPSTAQFYFNGSYQNSTTTASRYIGSKTSGLYSLGYYSGTPWNTFVGDYDHFANASSALTDFFGDNPSMGGTVLNDAIIVNENPVINPVTLTSALGYPYKQTIINNYNNVTPIPWHPNNYNYVDYNYNFDVPFWNGQELETLEYPEEIEFPSVEFETIEVDQSVDNALENLNGSWIVEFFLVAILLLILGLIL